MSEHNPSRRDFLKKTAYVAPVVLTLQAAPSLAAVGSARCNNGFGNGSDCEPPGHIKNGGGAHRRQDDV